MNKLDDDMLMAFVDGQLDDADRRAVELAVSSNPKLRKTLRVFELTREPVARAFDSVLRQPERQELLRLVRGRSYLRAPQFEADPAIPDSKIFSGIIRRFFRPTMAGPAVVVFSLLIIFGTTAAWQLGNLLQVKNASPYRLVAYENDRLIAQSDLKHTLETVPSGVPVAPNVSARKKPLIKPILTFKDVDKRFCREYEVLYHGAERYGGVACRSQDGSWQVLVHIEKSIAPSSKNSFKPAAGGKMPVLDNVINRIMGSNALDAAQEGHLLRNGWAAPSGN